MRKAVLISIKSEWCDFIKLGMKTVEVRKSRPNLDTPFKVYIYCTIHGCSFLIGGKHPLSGNGMVVGEFICDWITGVKCDNAAQAAYNRKHDTCLSDEEIMRYANNGKVYYWHISDLKIYDKPKELSEFSPSDCGEKRCFTCKCFDPEKPSCTLKRPPQSWQYVEELEDNSQLLGNASQSDDSDMVQDVLKPATPENFELMPG